MTILNKRGALALFLGDIIAFSLALWVTLFVRSWTLPSLVLLQSFILPFSILFIVWILVFFIAGLYEKHTNLLKSRIPSIILNAHITNMVIAFLFFYFIPIFGIAPKTTLIIYLFVSFAFILAWRLYGINFFVSQRRDMAILVGSGEEMRELYEEVNKNDRYNLYFSSFVDVDSDNVFDFQKDIADKILENDIETIVIDVKHKKVEPILSNFYNLIFSRVNFLEMSKVYEDIFDRIPLSTLKDGWFIENISTSPKFVYDILKRLMDIIVGVLLGVVSLIIYPFVYIGIKLEDGKELFSVQDRVGENNKIVKILKFRTMTFANDGGKWKEEGLQNKVTKFGVFLRKSRIDELPQLWNVIHGDISLIGPRPEFFNAVTKYNEEIPYYNIRHLIKPGLSGWAQIYGEHPHHEANVSMTKNKLSYDLYYVKNRSFMLDLKIALRTVAQLLSQKGR
jgi:exopolysaccharide biosynthesis polyprenyl glycosylphosphotransferase